MTTGPVWIDLANSPHVLFFKPVIDELHERGVETVVTARDFAQTTQLCKRFYVDAEIIGRHGGASLSGKLLELVQRVRDLRAFAERTRPCVAVSHNSYAQAVAARTLRLPVMTAMDYEYQPANHLAFRCADLVAVPEAFPLDRLLAQGARLGKTWRYHGLKEHIALAGFVADPGYLARAGIDTSRPVAVVRPPADMALYHRFGNPLFPLLLTRLAKEAVTTVLLARTDTQAADLEVAGFGALLWRGEALDGRQIVAGADAVVSAGGTMNREAAVLGTPAYSIYAGKLAAVDRALVAAGSLYLLHDAGDVARLPFRKKAAAKPPHIGDAIVVQFVDRLLAVTRR
jgi:predicted glycosyltransferase